MVSFSSLAAGVCVGVGVGYIAQRIASQQQRRALEVNAHRNEVLLSIVSEISAIEVPVSKQAEELLSAALKLVQCERFGLFLYEKDTDDLVSLVMTGGGSVRFPAVRGMAGQCAKSGKVILCNDVTQNRYYNPEVDVTMGFKTRSALTVPIVVNGSVIAVTQVLNKSVGSFTKEDEDTMTAFANVLAFILRNKSLYEHLSQISTEKEALLATTSETSVTRRLARRPSTIQRRGPIINSEKYLSIKLGESELRAVKTIEFDVLQYGLNTSKDQHDKLIPLALFFIRDLKVPLFTKISDDLWMHLLLAVRSTYRNVPYHNFCHAFDVTHALYLYLSVGNLRETFSNLEMLVLIIVGLFHDCDHSGLNNHFHTKALTPLGILSDMTGSQSVLETHHCNVALEVLSDPLCNVFSVLSPEESTQAWRLVVDCILATDMAKHKDLCADFAAFENGKFDKSQAEHRRAGMLLLTKAADISNLWKAPGLSVNWSRLVTEEFYSQGDAEKAKGVAVTPNFDREKGQELKKSTLGFISFVGIPFFEQVSRVFPSLQFVADGVHKNKEYWDSQP